MVQVGKHFSIKEIHVLLKIATNAGLHVHLAGVQGVTRFSMVIIDSSYLSIAASPSGNMGPMTSPEMVKLALADPEMYRRYTSYGIILVSSTAMFMNLRSRNLIDLQ